MGLLRRTIESFSAFFDRDKPPCEDIISLFEEYYWSLRKEFPGKDEHFYLARTLFLPFASKVSRGINPLEHISRVWQRETHELLIKTWKTHWEEIVMLFAYNETMRLAILDAPDSVRAVSYFFLYKETPHIPKYYVEEFSRLIAPVLRMPEEVFRETYKKKIPLVSCL